MYCLYSPKQFAVYAIRFQTFLEITCFFMWVSGDWCQAESNIMQRWYKNGRAK